MKVWNTRRYGHRERPDAEYRVPEVTADEDGGHAGADPLLIDEFLRFVRAGGAVREVPALDPALAAYFEQGQV